jgi:hypothetical protein
MIVEEGARGSALLEQEPRMLDGFIILPLGSCERRRSLKSLKGARELIVCRISRCEGLEGLVTLTRDEVEVTLEIVGVEGAKLG